MALSFRPIDIVRDLAEAIRFRRDSFVCSFGDDARFDEAEYVDWLRAKCKEDPELAVHVFLDEELIGQMEVGVSRVAPWVGYINLYYLRPEFRGRGLAHLLDAHAAALLTAKGHASARLSVSPSNERALRFYARQGWVDRGPRGDGAEVHVMEKQLVQTATEASTLTTDRLWLRSLSELDAPSYERHFVDYDVVRHLARRVPWPFPIGGVAAHFRALASQTGDRWLWGIFRKEAPLECIGAVDLFRPGRPQNRGFWLGKKFWGQGLMSEATTAVTDHAFDVLGFEELTLSNARENVRSRRVKEKTPARLIGVAPAEYVDPTFKEQELWLLTKQAWREFRARAKP